MKFSDFKKKQSELTSAIEKMAASPAKKNYEDERFWSFTKDSAGNANATIRFLPQQDLSKSPIVLTFRHGFQSAGRWFIEDCPHTVGEKCPVCEQSTAIWNEDEDTARKYWRAKTYIANILVVDDEANPENNGKVFLWKFGKQLYDIILETLAPEDEDEEGVNVFDFDEGLNFKLKVVQKSGYNNYQKSKFVMSKTAIDEDIQEQVFNSIHDLDEFLDKDKFKTYDEMLQKFTSVIGAKPVAPIQETKPAKTPDPVKSEPVEDEVPWEDNDDDDVDFDALLAED